jgi:ribosome recycling factor
MRQSIEKIKPEFEKVVDYFKRELQKIRSGKASPSLVEDIVVDCFGSKLPGAQNIWKVLIRRFNKRI